MDREKRFNLAKRWYILVEGVCLECIVYLVIKWPIYISKYLRANFSFTLDMLDTNLLCKFVLQMVEKHLRLMMAV